MVKHFALTGITQCVLGMAILAMASEAAMAQTTTLICNLDPSLGFAEDEPTTIELNEAQNSVVVHFSQQHNPRTGERLGGSHSIGPLPASFGTDVISFTDPTQVYFHNYTINRLTGKFVGSVVNDAGSMIWTCQAGKKQF
jgi:hypothetical protein